MNMNKIITAVLSVAVALNVLYTVYAFNELNKWRGEYIDQQKNGQSDIESRLKFVEMISESNHDNIINNGSESRQSDSKIVQTMMGLETRLYELEDKLELFKCNPLANDCK